MLQHYDSHQISLPSGSYDHYDLRGSEVSATDGTSLGMITEVYGSKDTDLLAYVEVMTNTSPTKVLMLPFESLQWKQDGSVTMPGSAKSIIDTAAYQEEVVWHTWGSRLTTYDEMICDALTGDYGLQEIA